MKDGRFAMTVFDASAAVEIFPDMKIAFLVAAAQPAVPADGADSSARIIKRMHDSYGSSEALVNHPLIEGYREFYTGMNVRPSSASTPIKQALRVFERGYRSIHPAVDISMEIEYVTLCSFQVYDREGIGNKISYTVASGGEELPERAHGTGKCKFRKGELLLADERGVINSPSCGNAASRVVTATSTKALVRIFKIPMLGDDVFDSAVSEASERLAALHTVVLDRGHPSVEVDEAA